MKKISQTKHTGKIIKNVVEKNEIKLNYLNLNFSSIKIKKDGFTNYCKDIFEIHSLFCVIMTKFLPHFQNMTLEELMKEKHCHCINGDKRKLCYEILKKYNPGINTKLEELSFFQFGIEGLRIISHRIGEKNFDLLFIDCHHLIYGDFKYNDKDYNAYRCCISNLDNRSKDLKNEITKLEEENLKLRERVKEYEYLLEEKTQP